MPLASGTLKDRDVEELGRKLERDPSFHRDFDADPVAAAEAAKFLDGNRPGSKSGPGDQQRGRRARRSNEESMTHSDEPPL